MARKYLFCCEGPGCKSQSPADSEVLPDGWCTIVFRGKILDICSALCLQNATNAAKLELALNATPLLLADIPST